MEVGSDTLEDLGWSSLLRQVSGYAQTAPGTEQLLATAFFDSLHAAQDVYARVGDLMATLSSLSPPSLRGLTSIEATLLHVDRGGTAGADSLLGVMQTARSVSAALAWVDSHKANLKSLSGDIEGLADFSLLAQELAATFDEHGNIRDDASPELSDARRNSASSRQRAKAKLEQYLKREEVSDVLQDEFYTERDDRYVVPVVAALQSRLAGILHGTSASGQTVYVEPEDFIGINNDVKVAEAAVQREERRVLSIRSEWVAAESETLRAAFEFTRTFDTLLARAAYALHFDAAIPTLVAKGGLCLRDARHPLLLAQGLEVVANDLITPDGASFIIVSGPNAGGKTIALKMAGLLLLMARAAIPIPADARSKVPWLRALHSVMGDAQSLESKLSTFSGHLMKVQDLLQGSGPGVMVFMDELMVGTEPERGAALATAVLEHLAESGAMGVVTTHFERLKVLALGDPRFVNASVGLNRKTQLPDYRLKMGEAGTSSPFEVASKLGFPPALLHRASDLMHGGAGVSEALQRLESARAESEEMRLEAERAWDRLEEERVGLAAMSDELDRRAEREVERLQAETAKAAEEGLERIRQLVRELQRGDHTAQQVEEIRKEVIAIAAEAVTPPVAAHSPVPEGIQAGPPLEVGDVQVGDHVWVTELGQAGEIIDVARGGKRLTVLAGSIRLTLAPEALRGMPTPPRPKRVRATPPKPAAPAGAAAPAKGPHDTTLEVPPPRTESNSIDIRGSRREEVAFELEPLLDRAFRAEYDAVWIIHGHGTGVLREEVRAVVRNSTQVRDWRPGQRHEGGDGVTIAWIERP